MSRYLERLSAGAEPALCHPEIHRVLGLTLGALVELARGRDLSRFERALAAASLPNEGCDDASRCPFGVPAALSSLLGKPLGVPAARGLG